MSAPTDRSDSETGWHSRTLDSILDQLGTDRSGLSTDDARARLERYGRNDIEMGEGPSAWRIFLAQYTSVLIWILVVAAAVMALVGYRLDATVIAGIILFITIFGFVQDYRAEQSIQALKEMSTRVAIVRRDGETTEIDARHVVPGDVLLVSQGDVIPADARLIESSNLRVDESALTGESLGVSKSVLDLDKDTPLAERRNMLYKQTSVERGSGRAVVVGTGADTEMGRIASALQRAEDRDTPFQADMDRLGRIIAAGVVGIVAIIAIAELIIGDTPPLQVFLTAVGIAVSAVPEGLPAVVTVSLAIGARRMAEQQALVRRLPIVEALGSVDVICTDKTGTLTEEEMTVQRVVTNNRHFSVTGTGYDSAGEIHHDGEPVDDEVVADVMRAGMLCSNVEFGKREHGGVGETERAYIGDPTEISIFIAAQKAGLTWDELTKAYPRVGEIEFTSSRKRMTTVHETPGGGQIAYMKGAPETVLERCTHERIDGKLSELTDERRTELEDIYESLAAEAFRVMGFAEKRELSISSEDDIDPDIESGMTFLGFQGMLDPPRQEVPDAIAGCLDAGIDVVMITGDNAVTARAIAHEVGLETDRVITGNELDDMDDAALSEVVEDVNVFARTAPEHKTRILQTLQAKGYTVAMTGDGVNDAPAVKNADVGIAMGVRGTDVTEQASDIVLLDDNFASIRNAVRGGRRVFDNVRKFVNYLLSGNGGEVTMIFTGSMAGLGLVITPLQILWINVVTDGIPALSLGVDPAADDVMERPPRPPGEGVITRRIVTSIVGIAAFMTVCLLPIFTLNYYGDVLPGYDVTGRLFGWRPGYEASRELAQTMVFTGFVTMEIVRIQAIRFRYGLGLLSNYWLVLAVMIAITLQLIVLYTPTGQLLFDVEPLAVVHWIQIGIATLVFGLLMAGFAVVQDQYFERY